MEKDTIESHDDSNETLSFAGMLQQDKDTVVKSSPDQNRLPADFLFSNSRLAPHSFPMSTSKANGILKESCKLTSRNASSSDNNNSSHTNGRRCLRQSSEGKLPDSHPAMQRRVTFHVSPIDRKWEYLGSAGPSLMVSSSARGLHRSRSAAVAPDVGRSKKEAEKKRGRGFFGSFMSVCRECYALEPSKQVENKVNVRGSVNGSRLGSHFCDF